MDARVRASGDGIGLKVAGEGAAFDMSGEGLKDPSRSPSLNNIYPNFAYVILILKPLLWIFRKKT